MSTRHNSEVRQFLDCPQYGPQDVTAEWYGPSRGGGSFIYHAEAAEYLDLEWDTYTRRVTSNGLAGDPAKVNRADHARVLVCQGCGAVVRVWLAGRPVNVPTSGSMAVPLHKRRQIDVATGATARHGKCGGACLGGKRSCDCQCGGFCHGAGTCRCAERVESERARIEAARAGAPHAERLVFTGGGTSGYACGDCGAEEGTPHPVAATRAVAGDVSDYAQHRVDYPAHAGFSDTDIDRWESFGTH